MRQTRLLFVLPLLTLTAFAPAATLADEKDDLEATITVLDDPSELPDTMRRLEAPDDNRIESTAPEEDAPADDGFGIENDDGFEHDAVHDDDEIEHEDDFEEGEEIDDDAFDT